MPLIIGTAGHIDHGKTALVRALTGQDTDRLEEEKARGISIDLGFAWLEGPGGERVGIVDVPGHERFIRNMLAGAHGIDLVLFTVAADDGVMPQTEEHLDILHVLGVRRGIFVITKSDLVDEARIAAVREEIAILALDTALADAPVLAVSTATGAGLEGLRVEIAAQLARASAPPSDGWFRLPIDRAFVMRGHGVVVTGTAMAGEIAEGDAVTLLPRGVAGRVRGLEVHGERVARARRGQRVAINLAGVDHGEVARGDVICEPRIVRATTRFDARLEVRPGARRALESHQRVRVHVGTAEALGRVVLLGEATALPPRRAGWAQIVLRSPVVALRGDHFVLRDEAARWTLGGGTVVHPFARPHRRTAPASLAVLERLHGGSDAEAAVAVLEDARAFAVDVDALAQTLGLRLDRVAAALGTVPDAVPIPDATAPEAWTTAATWARFEEFVLDSVTAHHRAEPMAVGLEMESLRGRLPWPVASRIFRWGVDRLVAGGRLARDDQLVRLPSHRAARGAVPAERLAEAARLLEGGGFTPPDLRQLGEATGLPAQAVQEVLAVLEREGRAVRIARDLWWARQPADEALGRLRAHCAQHGEITAAVFRDLIGASRKFAIAFLDWTDRTGVTLRVGDVRRLRR
jgi:selenocysteine-specific elongation factor